MARRRAGITQRQLAERSGHPRESIVRWEAGAREPSLTTLQGVVSACDLDLVIHLAKLDSSLNDLVADQLRLAPLERLSRLVPAGVLDDILRALRWLASSRTPTIVIGAVAAALQGAPQRSEGSQVEVVSSDPFSTEGELREAGLTPVETETRWADVDRRAPWALADGGAVVLATETPGTAGYTDLRRSADEVDLGEGLVVEVAHPRDLLRLADASPRDRERVPGLRALLDLHGKAAIGA